MLIFKRWLTRFTTLALIGIAIPAPAAAFCLQPIADSPLSASDVTILGAVEQPGPAASEAESMRASDALDLAGGLRDDAYPLGAMLFRRLPETRGDAATAAAERDLAAGALDGLQLALSGPYDDDGRSRLIGELRAGARFMRLPVAADPALQRRFPERNPVLAPGDVLFVPTRSENVTVIGAVRAPSRLSFEPGAMADDYVEQAGGWLPGARKQRSAVYLPDGRLRGLSLSFWNYKPTAVPPGSIIVVPYRDESLQKYARDMLSASMFAELAQREDEAADAGAPRERLTLLPDDPATEYSTMCR